MTNNINEKLLKMMVRRKNMFVCDLAYVKNPNRKNKEYTSSLFSDEELRLMHAGTAVYNMETLGYKPSTELFKQMKTVDGFAELVCLNLLPVLAELKGADVKYIPMYKDFPSEVLKLSEAELYLNAIVHYITYGTLSPNSTKKEKARLDEYIKLKTVTIGTESDVKTVFANILNSASVWSALDRQDVATLIQKYGLEKYMPKFMTARENMAFAMSILIACEKESCEKVDYKKIQKIFKNQVKTATDVLRLMNVLNGNGDASLRTETRIGKLTRAERRFYMSLLESCNNIAEDMKMNKSLWIKIGEKLHPGEFKERFPKSFYAFDSIRDKNKLKTVKTNNAKAEMAFSSGNTQTIREYANEKPGILARNLARLLRDSDNQEEILAIWESVADKIDPNLLWQVHSHFKRRVKEADDENRYRVFILRKPNATSLAVKDETKSIDKTICEAVLLITENALKKIYAKKPAMGNVYISPEIRECKIPTSSRSDQASAMPLGKGSRLALEKNTNYIRAFLWWTNINSKSGDVRVDVDLSASFLSSDLSLVDYISYYGLRNDYAVHSGDIINGGPYDGEGVAEFIDIDIDQARFANIRYVTLLINVYSANTFDKLNHIKFGYMTREKSLEGEIFEPATVKQVVKPTAPSSNELVCIFDLETKEMVWADEVGYDNFMSKTKGGNNLHANLYGTTMACYKVLHLEKPSVYDVIRVNTEARGGQLVCDKENADLIFALDEGINPGELEYFTGNLMPAKVSKEFNTLTNEVEAEEENEK